MGEEVADSIESVAVSYSVGSETFSSNLISDAVLIAASSASSFLLSAASFTTAASAAAAATSNLKFSNSSFSCFRASTSSFAAALASAALILSCSASDACSCKLSAPGIVVSFVLEVAGSFVVEVIVLALVYRSIILGIWD